MCLRGAGGGDGVDGGVDSGVSGRLAACIRDRARLHDHSRHAGCGRGRDVVRQWVNAAGVATILLTALGDVSHGGGKQIELRVRDGTRGKSSQQSETCRPE